MQAITPASARNIATSGHEKNYEGKLYAPICSMAVMFENFLKK
jgi:hypothetical protein